MSEPIVVIGSSNTDMVIKMQRLPKPGETLLGGDFIKAAGGKGANQAVAAARLGGEVTFVARVGTDIFGSEAIENFRKDGIDVEHVSVDPVNPSGVALIFVDDNGENCIAVASSANNHLAPTDVGKAGDQIAASKVLLMQLEIPLETVQAAAEIADQNNVTVILNPAPAADLSDELLRSISIITPNETELQLLTGHTVTDAASAEQAARVLQERGVETVIVTMGSQGAFLLSEDLATMIPSKTITAQDTTAAGDAFNGALAYALASGMVIQEAVQFANMTGALSATKLGAQPSMPTLEQLQAFIRLREPTA